jgi:hypothetical protein
VTWAVDFTSQARADLVGLDADVSDALTETLLRWMATGPPQDNGRRLAGVLFYEFTLLGRYLLGYSIKDDPPALVVLWLRRKPGTSN